MAIEIVDLPMKNGGSFHSYVSHYQRVTLLRAHQAGTERIYDLITAVPAETFAQSSMP